ncbi:Sensors of blue-light using FAD [Sphingopyxis sp. YR583]|uniref:BLUF domain-containing protein n=1 Tax=Sphingopyxis sp. YR583 TaxID=1881047 RepID=UPI0008A7B801|nr:BLUF domain-containing protein [Sphingopyxis sp. YR583]SEH13493.1 Sensors of blue-light using FAD [Sphingopyxis sp. YR583]
MLSVTYVSVADPSISDEEIASILVSARRNNVRDELTGALVYNGHNFLQLLEGPDEKVEACLAVIRDDARHSGMIEVRRRTIEARDFGEWAMLYDPRFEWRDDGLSRLAADGRIDAVDEKIFANFIALGRRPFVE